MQRHDIPTARYASFTKDTIEEGLRFLESMKAPYVLKADGLAAGKGVVILENLQEAQAELKRMLLEEKFGTASQKVVIEEFLKGIELSCFVLTDGESYKVLPTAKDYKRIGEGDTGLNTGGMGAVSPVPFANEAFMQKIEERIIKPTIETTSRLGITVRSYRQRETQRLLSLHRSQKCHHCNDRLRRLSRGVRERKSHLWTSTRERKYHLPCRYSRKRRRSTHCRRSCTCYHFLSR